MIHTEILSNDRRKLLPVLAKYKSDFYLAGGTGLALQLGHRDSVDFDFFNPKPFESNQFFEENIKTVFPAVKIIQSAQNTLSVIVDESVNLSFLSYQYPLINPLVKSEFFNIGSIADIGCMKLSAITSRSSFKDYVDIYYVLQIIHLDQLLKYASEKYPSLDIMVILKSLVYFGDIVLEPILFKDNNHPTLEDIKQFLNKTVSQCHNIKTNVEGG